MKDRKGNQPFLMDGKGIYVGESLRSMYERGKEHWLLDHPEIEETPKFNFKIISTFKDPLTRKLAERLRIERRCQSILNYKSEYSRCPASG